jgi:hypothetical protein
MPTSSSQSTVWKCGAVGGRRFIDPPLEPGGNEGDDDRDEVDVAFVSDDVRVVAVVDEA